MTKLAVLAVFDSAVGAFNRPMFAPSVPSMVRSFSDEVNRKEKDNQMSAHPDDFTLFSLGVFDDVEGSFDCKKTPVIRAKDVFKE